MIISIASGKGGTGKTTIATNLALSIKDDVQLLDCDVEEPNAHIFIQPKFIDKNPVLVPVPHVDYEKCNFCGKCADICAFNAIAVTSGKVLIFPELCHSCGACQYFCPTQAIHELNREVGSIEFGAKNNLEFIKGKLNIGEVVSIPVIQEVKKHIDQTKTVIIDAPPGTSCPVIASIKGSDFCILVTEPTPFGLNDLILAVGVLRKMNIPFAVVINRCDLGNKKVEEYCKIENIPILLTIPFKKEIATAYAKGILLIEIEPKYKEQFCALLEKIHNILIK
jgi:MinD superfamily P-loop ATPase